MKAASVGGLFPSTSDRGVPVLQFFPNFGMSSESAGDAAASISQLPPPPSSQRNGPSAGLATLEPKFTEQVPEGGRPARLSYRFAVPRIPLNSVLKRPVLNLRVARQDQEKSRPGATPNGFLMRLPARHCSGSAASAPDADATWLT